MLQRLERADHDVEESSNKPRVATKSSAAPIDQDDGLLAEAIPIMIVAYAIALAAAVITFKANAEALFAVVISIGFAVVFFAVPLLLGRVRGEHDARLRPAPRQHASDRVETFTGIIRRPDALVQMVIVPIAVGLGFSCFALVWALVRP